MLIIIVAVLVIVNVILILAYRRCVKKEMEDERLLSNPLMVAANQLHNLKVQLGPTQFIIL